MSNEQTKWLEQNDHDARLADTGLNARADLTGHRRLSGQEQSIARELAQDFVEKFGF